MCTLVCRWSPGTASPIEMLALRDELASRAFDVPGAWWPEQPDVIGGRDRTAGGTWCATDVRTGQTAVVLNGGDHRKPGPEAASRGVLPLVALDAGPHWPEALDFAPMASFNLVLAAADRLTWWSYHGQELEVHELPAGLHLFTPHGLADEVTDPRLVKGRARPAGQWSGASTATIWGDWLPVVSEAEASEDPLAMLVEIARDGEVFRTVFGQFIIADKGKLRVDYTLAPADRNPWTVETWASGAKDPATARPSR